MKVNNAYTGGYNKFLIGSFSQRKIGKELSFMLPYLEKGMNILDGGCGPGNMTLEIAKIVKPGKVIGLDIEEEQFKKSDEKARNEDLDNLCFVKGNAQKLPFEDSSFDLVLYHALLFHLSKPKKALKEAYRVLKKGGIICCRDSYMDGDIFYPQSNGMNTAMAIACKVLNHYKSDPDIGIKHGKLLDNIGFKDMKRSASYDFFDSGSMVKSFRTFVVHYISELHYDLIIEKKWSTDNEIKTIIKELKDWGNQPLAFYARSRCEIIGFKP